MCECVHLCVSVCVCECVHLCVSVCVCDFSYQFRILSPTVYDTASCIQKGSSLLSHIRLQAASSKQAGRTAL